MSKPDSPKTIIRLQRDEIKGLMESNGFYKKDVEYYKDKYNKIAAERDELKHRLWQYDIVEQVLRQENERLRALFENKVSP